MLLWDDVGGIPSKCKDLSVVCTGDLFTLLEPDESVVYDEEGCYLFRATSDAYLNAEGIYQINYEGLYSRVKKQQRVRVN